MDEQKILEDVKVMRDIPKEENGLDEKLKIIIRAAISRLTFLTQGEAPPDSMSHIIVDVALARFNRVGSEGLDSHTVEGESMQFSTSDFDGYMDEINAFNDKQGNGKKGAFRFL